MFPDGTGRELVLNPVALGNISTFFLDFVPNHDFLFSTFVVLDEKISSWKLHRCTAFLIAIMRKMQTCKPKPAVGCRKIYAIEVD